VSLYNPTKNFIYIHIPKTGGTSLESLGWIGEGFNKHYDIKFFKDTYENTKDFDLDKVFKFCFVRNPYDRFASGVLGHALPSNKLEVLLGTMGKDEAKKIDTERFRAFATTNRENFDKIVAIRPQHSFVTIDGKMVMDFVGRFENLQDDFNTLCDRFGFNRTELPHMVKGRYNKYDSFYTPEIREIVADHYSKDFEMFGYGK